LVGARLVAYNTVTKGPVVVIDFSRAEFVEDTQAGFSNSRSNSPITTRGDNNRASRRTLSTAAASSMDDDEEPYHVERSFKVLFATGEEISFFADTDQEKDEWMSEFERLIGNVPPRYPWAEIALKIREARTAASAATTTAASSSSKTATNAAAPSTTAKAGTASKTKGPLGSASSRMRPVERNGSGGSSSGGNGGGARSAESRVV
jgi:hypothetical protein